MRDEKEERKKQARSNKQTNKAKQHSTPKAVTFPRKNELPRVGLEPTTLYTLDRALYQLSYRGSPAGWAQISHLIVHLMNSALPTELPRQPSWLGPNLTSHSTPDEQANHQLSMKEKAGVMKPPMTPNTKPSIYMFLNER